MGGQTQSKEKFNKESGLDGILFIIQRGLCKEYLGSNNLQNLT